MRALSIILSSTLLLCAAPRLEAAPKVKAPRAKAAKKKPSAKDRRKAKRLKAKANKAYKDEDYAKALEHLDAAYALNPSPSFLANKALILRKLERYEEAVEALKLYLESAPPEEKASRANKLLAELQPTLKIDTDPTGAVVTLREGERRLGRTPLTVQLVAGRRALILTHPNTERMLVELVLEPGADKEARYTLVRREAVRLEPIVLPPKPEPEAASRAPAWITLGSGIALGVLSGGMYALAASEVDARDDARDRAAWNDHQGAAEGWYYGSLVGGGISVGLIGAGAWMLSQPARPAEVAQQPR